MQTIHYPSEINKNIETLSKDLQRKAHSWQILAVRSRGPPAAWSRRRRQRSRRRGWRRDQRCGRRLHLLRYRSPTCVFCGAVPRHESTAPLICFNDVFRQPGLGGAGACVTSAMRYYSHAVVATCLASRSGSPRKLGREEPPLISKGRTWRTSGRYGGEKAILIV